MAFVRSLPPWRAGGARTARRAPRPARGRPAIAVLLCSFGLGLLAGCASGSPPAKEPVRLDIAIAATARVNADVQGRPAPIQLRVYELKTAGPFEAADYFTLSGNDKSVLQADLLARNEYLLRPGERQRLQRRSHADTTAIGVIAGYRDLPTRTWRVLHLLPEAPDASWMRTLVPARKVRLRVTADEDGLRIEDAVD